MGINLPFFTFFECTYQDIESITLFSQETNNNQKKSQTQKLESISRGTKVVVSIYPPLVPIKIDMAGLHKAEIEISPVLFKTLHLDRELIATDKIPIVVKDVDNFYEQNNFITLHKIGNNNQIANLVEDSPKTPWREIQELAHQILNEAKTQKSLKTFIQSASQNKR